MRLSLILAVAALHITLSTAADLPFIGKLSLLTGGLVTSTPCRNRFTSDHFKTGTFIKVDEDRRMLIYGPPSCPACGRDAPYKLCYRRIELKISRWWELPYIARYPQVQVSRERNPTAALCRMVQKPEYFWPVGAGQPHFIKAVKEMAAGAKSIAGFKCDGSTRYVNNPLARELHSYLAHLAWKFSPTPV